MNIKRLNNNRLAIKDKFIIMTMNKLIFLTNLNLSHIEIFKCQVFYLNLSKT